MIFLLVFINKVMILHKSLHKTQQRSVSTWKTLQQKKRETPLYRVRELKEQFENARRHSHGGSTEFISLFRLLWHCSCWIYVELQCTYSGHRWHLCALRLHCLCMDRILASWWSASSITQLVPSSHVANILCYRWAFTPPATCLG